MKRMLFLGDSITDCDHNYDMEGLGDGYVRKVHERLFAQNKNCRIQNKGFDGFTLQALKRLWKREAEDLNFDVLTILIGINDIGVIHNTGADAEFSLAEFCLSYRLLLEDIRKRYVGPVIVMEPFIFPYPQRYQLRFDSLRIMNEGIRSAAKEYGAAFVPLWEELLQNADDYGYDALTTDGIHLTDFGHEILAKKWLDCFKELEGQL